MGVVVLEKLVSKYLDGFDESAKRVLRAKLSSICWSIVGGGRGDADLLSYLDELNKSACLDFDPCLRHQLFEIKCLSILSSLSFWHDKVGGIPDSRRLSEFMHFLHKERRAGLNVTSAEFFLAACEMMDGKHDAGIEWILRANMPHKENVITPFFSYGRGSCSLKTVERVKMLPKMFNSYRKELIFDAFPKVEKPVIMCSADSKYTERFLLNYVNSIEQYAKEDIGAFHMHIVLIEEENVDLNNLENVLDLAREHLSVPLTVSWEKVYNSGSMRTYFATSRFLVAKHIIDGYRVPLLITDIDFELRSSLREFIISLTGTGVSLQRNSGLKSLWPWLATMAGAVYLEDCKKTQEFLMLLERAFLSVYSPKITSWGIDQHLLTSVSTFLENQGVEIGNILGKGIPRPFTVPLDLKKNI